MEPSRDSLDSILTFVHYHPSYVASTVVQAIHSFYCGKLSARGKESLIGKSWLVMMRFL
jgi:hypothetical protein